MFFHDNGKIAILCCDRCGNTSMHKYFGVNIDYTGDKIDRWKNSQSRKILVLRDPYDRMKSAINHTFGTAKYYIGLYHKLYSETKSKEVLISSIIKNKMGHALEHISHYAMIENFDDALIEHAKQHFCPYLHRVYDVEFEIIDFKKIHNYIELRAGFLSTEQAVDYSIFDCCKLEMQKEHQLYKTLFANKKEISIDEWKVLTSI